MASNQNPFMALFRNLPNLFRPRTVTVGATPPFNPNAPNPLPPELAGIASMPTTVNLPPAGLAVISDALVALGSGAEAAQRQQQMRLAVMERDIQRQEEHKEFRLRLGQTAIQNEMQKETLKLSKQARQNELDRLKLDAMKAASPGGLTTEPESRFTPFDQPTTTEEVGGIRLRPLTPREQIAEKTRLTQEDLTKLATEETIKARIRAQFKEPVEKGTLQPLVDPTTGEVKATFHTGTGRISPITGGGEGLRRTPLSTAELDRQASLQLMMDNTLQLEELLTVPGAAQSVGPVSGQLSRLEQATIGASEEATLVHQIANDLSDQLLRARSGAQINEQEYQRLRKLLPDPTRPLSDFTVKLKQFKSNLEGLLAARKLGPRGAETSAPAGKVKKFNPATGQVE